MDLHTIESVLCPESRGALPANAAGDAFLAGGTWLFSEPQRGLRRLIDLRALGWPPLAEDATHLRIGATCTLAELDARAAAAPWAAAALVRACCRALWGSFKIGNAATVGGNLCLALPAAPMAALAVALEAGCVVWEPGGGERVVPAASFVAGPGLTCLREGEILRRLDVPLAMLRQRFAVRQASLTEEGRSAALLAGRLGEDGLVLTVTAATPRPLRLAFAGVPERAALRDALDRAAAAVGWFDDVHGAPDWRRHMTLLLAAEIRAELLACG